MDILDFYGTSYSFNTLGKSSFKTWFSFTSSLFTLALVAVSTWLIGKDFFYKTNPKIVNSTFIPEVSEPVYINNRNFTFAFREESVEGRVLEESELFAFPHIQYDIFKADENGSLFPFFNRVYDPVPCLETEAKENPGIQQFNPSTLKCIDMRKIEEDIENELKIKRDHDLELYGTYSEKYSAIFYITYSNCKYKDGVVDESSCVSFEEAVEKSRNFQFLSMFVPRVIFSPENYENPLTVYYENVLHPFSPYTQLMHGLKYSLYKLEDDKGWIFENIEETVLLDLHDQEKEYRFLTEDAFRVNNGDVIVVQLGSQTKQVRVKRMFLKLQELAANVGGIIKLVFFAFNFSNKLYSRYRIESFLIEKYSTKSLVQGNNASREGINPYKVRNEAKISFVEYFKIRFKCTKNLKHKKALLDGIQSKLDIQSTMQLCSIYQDKTQGNNTQLNTIRFENRISSN